MIRSLAGKNWHSREIWMVTKVFLSLDWWVGDGNSDVEFEQILWIIACVDIFLTHRLREAGQQVFPRQSWKKSKQKSPFFYGQEHTIDWATTKQ